MAAHWSLYFFSARVSTVAVAMVALFSFPLMTAVLEPAVFREPLRAATLGRTGLALVGVMVMVGFGLDEPGLLAGVGLGLASAACFAVRNVAGRHVLRSVDPAVAMAWQVAVVAVVLLPTVWMVKEPPDAASVGWLLVLGLVITGVGHTIFLSSFRHVPVATASVIGTLQPVYGSVIAWVALGERPTLSVLAGGSLILVSVVLETLSRAGPTDGPARGGRLRGSAVAGGR